MNTSREFAIPREALDDEGNRQEKINANLNSLNLKMREVLRGESVGGNAGSEEVNGEVLDCKGVNFCHDKGVIKEMGNIQNLSPAARNFDRGRLKLGVIFNRDENGQPKDASSFIVGVDLRGVKGADFTESVKVMEGTKLQYNIEHAKSEKDLFFGLDLHKGKLYDSKKRELDVNGFLKPAITAVIHSEMDPRFITGNYGLRKKVIELRDKFLESN